MVCVTLAIEITKVYGEITKLNVHLYKSRAIFIRLLESKESIESQNEIKIRKYDWQVSSKMRITLRISAKL